MSSLLFGGARLDARLADAALVLFRVYFGLTMMLAGLDKLPLPEWMVDQVVEVGFPFPAFMGWMASFVEFAGGFLIVIGWLTRPAAFLLAFSMSVAAFGFHGVLPLVDMHIAQGYVWAFVLLTFMGAGHYSMDRVTRDSGRGRRRRTFESWCIVLVLALFGIGLYLQFGVEPATAEDVSEVRMEQAWTGEAPA